MAEKFSKQAVIEAINAACGVKTEAARLLGCHRHTITNYAKRHPEVAEALVDANDQLLDEAETALIDLVRERDFRAIRYVLNCKGRERGWGDRRDQQKANSTSEERPAPIMFYPASGIRSRMRNRPDDEELAPTSCSDDVS